VADTAGDAVDYAGDEAGDAYDAAADMAGDAADAVVDAGEAVADTAGDAVDYVGDKAGDAADAIGDVAGETYDASVDMSGGAAMAGAGMVGAAVYDSSEGRAGTAADLNSDQMAAEPTADEIRIELEDYLKSFGPSSEFRKPIEYVEGIGAAFGQKLRAIGIDTVLDLVANGATRRGRKHIADQTGIAQSLILTWVNHVDLFRIKGVAEEYADLLEQSGVDTVVELAQRNPANLYKRMKDINEQKELVRRIPHASEVESWVQQAKSLRRLIYY
jgi:predicted flap endonuclease-1-like 5' DNA nuclease